MRKFDWNDITLKPAEFTDIKSRSEIKVKKLPLFVSPMDTVIDEKNAKKFLSLNFSVCLPRHIKWEENKDLSECFFSFGLEEIIDIVENKKNLPPKVLIDIANGHIKKLYDVSKIIKEKYNVTLMIGNIANPDTYRKYSEIGVDYIRCGIGGGSSCTTSANGAVHYPMASLIKEIYEYKKDLENYGISCPKIVADGGFKNYSDIIKCLAIGSDFVMLGGVLNKALESCSPCFIKEDNGYKEVTKPEKLFKKTKLYKYYRGMSTKEVQEKWGKKNIKTAEGISFFNEVEYTLSGWTENFKDYLKSSMSYTDSIDLNEFKKSEFIFITQMSYKRYNK